MMIMRTKLSLLVIFATCVTLSGCLSGYWASRVEATDFHSSVLNAHELVAPGHMVYSVVPVAAGAATPNFSFEDRIDDTFAVQFDKNSMPERLGRAARNPGDSELRFSITTNKERVGDKLSISEPAEFGFNVVLIRGGQAIWKGDFFVKDHAVTDDLYRLSFSTRGGVHWRTAEELARYGLELAAKALAEDRQQLMLDRR